MGTNKLGDGAGRRVLTKSEALRAPENGDMITDLVGRKASQETALLQQTGPDHWGT